MSPIDAVSRRRFLSIGAASCAAFPFLAQAQEAAQQVVGSGDAWHRLTIPVMIGDKGPFNFVVDTGADRTVIADDLAATLGLAPGPMVSVQGIARCIGTTTAYVNGLSFGTQRMERLEMPVLPRASLGADGYLGLDAIDGHRVSFDFRNHRLEVTSAPRFPLKTAARYSNETIVPAHGENGRLRSMGGMVDDIPVHAFLDSGAEVSIGNSALLNALLARSPSYASTGTLMLTGVTGGSLPAAITQVKRVHLGAFSFSDPNLVIADLDIFDLWELRRQPALLIGMEVLRQFANVTIDYGRKEYRFEFAELRVASANL